MMAFGPLIGSNLNDRFFELGGHLRIAARLVSRIRPPTVHEIAVAALSYAATIGSLAGYVTPAERVSRIGCRALNRDGSLVTAGPGQRIS